MGHLNQKFHLYWSSAVYVLILFPIYNNKRNANTIVHVEDQPFMMENNNIFMENKENEYAES